MIGVRDIIAKKRDGEVLSAGEIRAFVDGVASGSVPDYQASALLMAAFLNGLSAEEAAALTVAMADSGHRVTFDGLKKPLVDKHSTGGVGDKVSLALGPLVAACGAAVPMVAGRGLGFTGGTLDKLESIPGFSVNLTLDAFERQVRGVGIAIMGQTREMAPADKKLYALRDVTATVESIPLITASILSKKVAEGTKALVLDVKVGRGALMTDLRRARALSHSIIDAAAGMDLPVRAVLTDMDAPLGRTVGNACEVAESVEVLEGTGDERLTRLVVLLGAHMLDLCGAAADLTEATQRIHGALKNGSGLKKFREMVAAQGGDPGRMPTGFTAARSETIAANRDGFVSSIDARAVGEAAVAVGAGRDKQEDDVDFGVGIEVHACVADEVRRGAPLLTVHGNDEERVKHAMQRLERAVLLVEEPVPHPPLILEVIG